MASDDKKKPHVDEDWKLQVELERAKSSASPEPQDEQGMFVQGFEGIVQMLVMQALMALGALADPDSDEEIPVDLSAARQLIEMLDILKAKTQGNLSEDESMLLTHHLTQVRMLYVEVQSQVAPAAAPKKSRFELP